MKMAVNTNLTRRRTLQGLLAIAITALTYKTLQLFHSFLHITPKPNSYGGTIDVCPLNELPAAGAPPEPIPEGRFWLVHDSEGLNVLHSSCTHLDCLFGWDEERNRFVCPCHGSEFSRDGALLKGPAIRPLDRFCLEIVDKDGNRIRDNFASQGAVVSIADLLPPPEEHSDAPKDETSIPPTRFFIRVDTSKKMSAAEIPG